MQAVDPSDRPSDRPALVRVFRGAERLQELHLEGTRYVVGRNHDAEICLDDPTVSRPHAELVCGPFGRWWIHDLGSTNGTKIDGDRVRKRMLHHRDQVKVGDFIIEFRHAPRDATIRPKIDSRPSISEDTIQIAAMAPASTRARIMPSHLAIVTEVGREMLVTESGEKRLEALLTCFIGEHMPADAAIALRVSRDGGTQTIGGPHRRFGPEAQGPYCSDAVLSALPGIVRKLWEMSPTYLDYQKKILQGG